MSNKKVNSLQIKIEDLIKSDIEKSKTIERLKNQVLLSKAQRDFYIKLIVKPEMVKHLSEFNNEELRMVKAE